MPDLKTAIRTAAREMEPKNPMSVLRAITDFPNSTVALELRGKVAEKFKAR